MHTLSAHAAFLSLLLVGAQASAQMREAREELGAIDLTSGFGPTGEGGAPLFRLGYEAGGLALEETNVMTIEGLRVPALVHRDGQSGVVAPFFVDRTDVRFVHDTGLMRGASRQADLRLRPPEGERYVEAQLGVGRVHVGGESDGPTPVRAMARVDQRAFAPVADPDDARLTMVDLGAQTRLELGGRSTLDLFVFGAADVWLEPLPPTRMGSRDLDQPGAAGGLATLTQDLGGGLMHRATLGHAYSRLLLGSEDDPDSWTSHAHTLWGSDTMRWQATQRVAVEGGLSVEHQRVAVERAWVDAEPELSGGRTLPLGWLQLELSDGRRWSGYAGVRAEALDEDLRVGGFGGAQRRLGDRAAVELSGGYAHGSWEHIYELPFWGMVPPDLEPSEIQDARLAVSGVAAPWLRLRLEGFGQRTRGHIHEVLFGADPLVDLVDTDLAGSRAEVRTNGLGPFDVWLDATYLAEWHTYREAPLTTARVSANTRYNWHRFGTEARWRYRYWHVDSSEDLWAVPAAIGQLDVRGDYRWRLPRGRELTVYAEGFNLTDQREDERFSEVVRTEGGIVARTAIVGLGLTQ